MADDFLNSKLAGSYTCEEYKSEVFELISLFKHGIAACEIPNLKEKKLV